MDLVLLKNWNWLFQEKNQNGLLVYLFRLCVKYVVSYNNLFSTTEVLNKRFSIGFHHFFFIAKFTVKRGVLTKSFLLCVFHNSQQNVIFSTATDYDLCTGYRLKLRNKLFFSRCIIMTPILVLCSRCCVFVWSVYSTKPQ